MSQYQGYQSYPPPYQPVPETCSLATISLVAGIASWVILPGIGAIVAVITGHMAKNRIRDSMGRLTGDGLATAGLVLGYVQIGLSICGICAAVLYFAGMLGVIGLSSRSYGLSVGLLGLLG